MNDAYAIIIGIILFIVFIWRFARTRQMYLATLEVKDNLSGTVRSDRQGLCCFLEKILLGRRIARPISFFIRGMVFFIVTICLLPFRDYQPALFWWFCVLTVSYVLWCFLHGCMLRKKDL